MIHATSSEESQETAALFALGALPQLEAQSFDEHLKRCRCCQRDVEGFEMVAGNLGFSAPEAEPAAATKRRVMSRIAIERSHSTLSAVPAAQSVLSDEGEWWPIQEGILVKLLHFDKSTRIQTSLVRMAAGMRLPAHRHKGTEQFFVLEGDCSVDGSHLGQGDYHRAEAGSIHLETYTEHGTLLLLIAPEDFEVLEAM